ncbi:MAG: hypothetical protein ACYDEP_13210 [Acidimicrobiales bacterium]
MSDVSRGSGWWIAADNKWYPPESHPNYQASTATPGTPSSSLEPASLQVTPRVVGNDRNRRSRLQIGGSIAVVAVVAVFVIVVTLKSGGVSVFEPGHGSATITWKQAGGGYGLPPRPFTGSINKSSLFGTATQPGRPSVKPNQPVTAEFHISTWTGMLAGRPFNLKLTASVVANRKLRPPTPKNPQADLSESVSFKVTGSYGSQPVHGVALWSLSRSSLLRFTGTIGNVGVTGTISNPNYNGKTAAARVLFTVTN